MLHSQHNGLVLSKKSQPCELYCQGGNTTNMSSNSDIVVYVAMKYHVHVRTFLLEVRPAESLSSVFQWQYLWTCSQFFSDVYASRTVQVALDNQSMGIYYSIG